MVEIMNKEQMIKLLKDYDAVDADKFIIYCDKLQNEKDRKNNKIKNPWMKYKTDEQLAQLFKQVNAEGLVFDGKHITLQSTGVSFDYIAYKNKMLIAYPESLMDISLVYKGDDFSFKKDSGKVYYTHTLDSPFLQTDNDVIGGYCVIKNNRGEFLTLIGRADLEKHRKVAKTDYIWKNWFKEMCMKTISKKACKQHFEDIFTDINTLDNENNDIEKPIEISVDDKINVEDIKDLNELKEYYNKNKDKQKNKTEFNKLVLSRKNQLEAQNGNC